jgi:hypothetical protein
MDHFSTTPPLTMEAIPGKKPVIFLSESARYADTGQFIGFYSRREEAIYAAAMLDSYEADVRLMNDLALG